jgi:elongator complex protein 5
MSATFFTFSPSCSQSQPPCSVSQPPQFLYVHSQRLALLAPFASSLFAQQLYTLLYHRQRRHHFKHTHAFIATSLKMFIPAQLLTDTNINWEEALKRPEIVKNLLDSEGRAPEWLINFAKYRYAAHKRSQTPEKSALSTVRRVRGRAPDSDGWIKKHNRYEGGVRKRKSESRKPRGMARPITLVQYQRHCIHLMSKVLSIRTNASPFTLILDDLNQRASLLMAEFLRRALSRNVNVVVVTFEPHGVAHPAVHLVPAIGDKTGTQILSEVEHAMKDHKESLVLVDSLYDLIHDKSVAMEALFGLVVGRFASTLVGTYHQDMLAPVNPNNTYAPQTLDVLKFMATCIITCKSLAHVLAAKAAKERSLPEPTHGLLQGAEGIVQSLSALEHTGIVLEAEFRHKSGRPESETYFLRPILVGPGGDYNVPLPGMAMGTLKQEFVILLDQVPAYNNTTVIDLVNAAGNEIESTFNLGLTDKQKAAREGVVLPYFDAQKGEGGEGGRILYDMGSEDDFDEEEDEI